ncbi:MAG: DUF1553 domain-containing protein [Planctomycetota bacterium]|nr:DUF1553 domain-containing protein [Planctomycetota bacterium]
MLLAFFKSAIPLRIALVIAISRLVNPVTGQDFDTKVAPVLASHCLECHAGKQPKGGLDLSNATSAFAGGESGSALVAKNLSESLLWEKIEENEMPPKHPLSAEDKQIVRDWIQQGATWGTSPIDRFAFTTRTRGGRDFWSLQPLGKTEPPRLDLPQLAKNALSTQWSPKDWAKNEVDHFIAKKLLENSLQPSRQADPRVLVRRLYFDLIGLPPPLDVIKKFEKNPSDLAYQQLVNDLLASKHYGERGARHWLDVVRFGESDGFERNNPRRAAWHYRDWVIHAFNNDLPYDQFVEDQLIGDLTTGGIEGAAATGFWVAGVHNTVVGGSKRMKLLARQDEIEEVLATLGQTFVGLTINCARCHDHKYDPITQKDYYQMASAISGLGHGEQTVKSQVDENQIRDLDQAIRRLRKQIAQIDAGVKSEIITAREKGNIKAPKPPQPKALWKFDQDFHDSIQGLQGKPVGNAKLENGALVLDGKSLVETEAIQWDVKEKTLEALVQLDDLNQRGGGAISIETRNGVIFDSIVFGEREPGQWMAGSNGFVRTDSFQAPRETEAKDQPVHLMVVYRSDGTITAYRNGKPYGRAIRKSGLQHYKAGETEFIFGLRHKPLGGAKHLKGKVFSAAFYDRALSAAEISAVSGDPAKYVSESEIVQWLKPEQRQAREALKAELSKLDQNRGLLIQKGNQKIYTLRSGGGATTKILLRGDPENVGEVVSPGAVAVVPGVRADFQLAPNAAEPDRRKKLAEWITSPANPLFSRVIANRVWHYHFGTGIVDTPNDFGFNGNRPSHPGLLDWLALFLEKNEFRLKALHRLIVNSAAYRQRSFSAKTKYENGLQPLTIDADNRLLWRMSPRRLEAESIRDAMLFVSGKLNNQLGGPSFEDVRSVSNNGTTYYFPIDEVKPEFLRRTIYRFNPRGGRSALLDTFDCPDPAATAPKRAVTTTPLQALSLLNNAFVLQMSKDFANRIQKEAGNEVSTQVDLAWQLAIGRKPSQAERKLSITLVKTYGLPSLSRALFNINEFIAID